MYVITMKIQLVIFFMSRNRWHSVQICDSSTSVVAELSHDRPQGTIPAFCDPAQEELVEVVPVPELVDEV
jgi:hypothetical protein